MFVPCILFFSKPPFEQVPLKLRKMKEQPEFQTINEKYLFNYTLCKVRNNQPNNRPTNINRWYKRVVISAVRSSVRQCDGVKWSLAMFEQSDEFIILNGYETHEM